MDKQPENLVIYLATLNRHTKAVNVVRFSPDGQYLASGGDDGIIYVWKLMPDVMVMTSNLDEDREEDKEVWQVVFTLRGHITDVYDLSWGPPRDDTLPMLLASGSTDNTTIVWDVRRGEYVPKLSR